METSALKAPPVAVEQALCSRFRTPKSACSACAELCPTGAIRIADRGAEIVGTCHGCGVCFAACPNGAFRITKKDDQTILGEIRERCTPPPSEFRIRCARGEGAADLVVPCLGRLTEVMVLEPLRLRAQAVEILEPACDACPSKRAVAGLRGLLRRARFLSELVGRESDAIRRRRVPLRSGIAKQERPVTRRDFLRAMQSQAVGLAASTSLPAFPVSAAPEGPSFRDLLEQRRDNPKRSLLIECLKGFAAREGEAPQVASRPSPAIRAVEVPAGDALMAALEVTPRCTACNVCATLCPTGAIIADWTDSEFVLRFRPWACTNCEVCVLVCGPKAIHARRTARLDSLLGTQEVRLFQAPKATCRLCRDAFPASGSEICPLCTEMQKRRLSALNTLFKENGSCGPRRQESASNTTAPSPASI
ncbi:MAG TPA: 4Fe-4S dicluster domain-containing protein [Methylomirabilota bacterium]|nr:4Fe-4S dicluster domain-containing protein [Methylomirabilota bacterium]